MIDTVVTDGLARPLHDLRISVTDRCNLRCQYCLPAELFGPDFKFMPRSQLLSYEEIERLVAAFLDLGVRKVRLTGGEPLLRRDIPHLVRSLRDLDESMDLAMTTNGLLLERHAEELVGAGLDRVNVSLDALDREIASSFAGRDVDPEDVWRAILHARDCGLGVKVNTVIKRGVNEGQVLQLAIRCKAEGIPLRFIEYMDVGTRNDWKTAEVVTGAEVLAMLRPHFELSPLPPEAPGETARRYGHAGCDAEVGFINSISAPFCGACNRARVSANGTLYTCLFAQSGLALKPWLLEEDPDRAELARRLRAHWTGRADRYSELRTGVVANGPKPEMWELGG